MLSLHFSTMSEEEFTSLPTSTNAVESHTQLSKHDKAEILCVALLTTYKIDMATAIEHMARTEGCLQVTQEVMMSKERRTAVLSIRVV